MAKDDVGKETSSEGPKDDAARKDEAPPKATGKKKSSSKDETPPSKKDGSEPADEALDTEGKGTAPPPVTWGQWFHAELLDLEKTVAALLVTALVVVAFNSLGGISKSSSEVMMTDHVTSDYVAEPPPPPEPTADLSVKGRMGPAPTMATQREGGGTEGTADTGSETAGPDPILDLAIEGRETDPAPVKDEDTSDYEDIGGGPGGDGTGASAAMGSALGRGNTAPPSPLEPDADAASPALQEPDVGLGEPNSKRLDQDAATAPDKEKNSSGVSNTLRNMLDLKDIAEIFIIVRAFFLLNVRRFLWTQPASPYPMSYAGAPGYPQQGYGYQQYGAQGGYQDQAAMYQGQSYPQQQAYQGQSNPAQQRPYRQY
ncbi:MAG: hypothetical protein QF415_02965 [Candidatus Undinarchaeales archaeon]|nr:hypothetical protein [Candidatus Undinarchaeales archaeon]MDP7492785.1 hypothetical protein [Candidatus Undinarchaeales archaeon]